MRHFSNSFDLGSGMDEASVSAVGTTGRRSRLVLAVAATWAACLVAVVFYAACWRLVVPRPHFLFVLLVNGTLGVAALAALLLGAWNGVFGPRRRWSLGLAMLGLAPIVWWAALIVDVKQRSDVRDPIQANTAVRVVAFWVSSIFDVAARWTYSRWTHGQHVVLMDDGQTPGPDTRVSAMDQQIAQMSALLGQPAPRLPVMWVRGSLFGISQRSFLTWALCGEGELSADVTYVDRHEAAHAAITAMCGPDQDPPAILAEGWAESQSVPRDRLLRTLSEIRDNERAYSLDELIQPEWYLRSDGPVYSHGGPLVFFLMDHYGPSEFFRLYAGVRRASFKDDCQRILGDSWTAVEVAFWKWLGEQVEKLPEESAADAATAERPLVELADGVDPADWKAIVDGYNEATRNVPPWPEEMAFMAEIGPWRAKPIGGETKSAHDWTIQCVITKDGAWAIDDQIKGNYLRVIVATPELAVDCSRGRDGKVHESFDAARTLKGHRDDALGYRAFVLAQADLRRFLPVGKDKKSPFSTRIDSIERPGGPGLSRWMVRYTHDSQKPNENMPHHYRLEIDSENAWKVKRFSVTGARGDTTAAEITFDTLFGRPTAIELKYRGNNATDDPENRTWTIRALSDKESREVCAMAESIARRSTPREHTPLYARFTRPFPLATIWTTLAVVIFGAGFTSRKRSQ